MAVLDARLMRLIKPVFHSFIHSVINVYVHFYARELWWFCLCVLMSWCLSVTSRYRWETRWDEDFGFSPYIW